MYIPRHIKLFLFFGENNIKFLKIGIFLLYHDDLNLNIKTSLEGTRTNLDENISQSESTSSRNRDSREGLVERGNNSVDNHIDDEIDGGHIVDLSNAGRGNNKVDVLNAEGELDDFISSVCADGKLSNGEADVGGDSEEGEHFTGGLIEGLEGERQIGDGKGEVVRGEGDARDCKSVSIDVNGAVGTNVVCCGDHGAEDGSIDVVLGVIEVEFAHGEEGFGEDVGRRSGELNSEVASQITNGTLRRRKGRRKSDKLLLFLLLMNERSEVDGNGKNTTSDRRRASDSDRELGEGLFKGASEGLLDSRSQVLLNSILDLVSDSTNDEVNQLGDNFANCVIHFVANVESLIIDVDGSRASESNLAISVSQIERERGSDVDGCVSMTVAVHMNEQNLVLQFKTNAWDVE